MRISDWSSDVCSSDLQFSLNSLRLFIHFITHFFINSPSIPVDSSSTLSLTSSSILPQFPSTLHPLYHSLLHQFSLNSLRLFIHFITHFFINSPRSEEHTSELQSLMRISYALFCLHKQTHTPTYHT